MEKTTSDLAELKALETGIEAFNRFISGDANVIPHAPYTISDVDLSPILKAHGSNYD